MNCRITLLLLIILASTWYRYELGCKWNSLLTTWTFALIITRWIIFFFFLLPCLLPTESLIPLLLKFSIHLQVMMTLPPQGDKFYFPTTRWTSRLRISSEIKHMICTIKFITAPFWLLDDDNELTEVFMDKWVTVGIGKSSATFANPFFWEAKNPPLLTLFLPVCGVVLAAVIIVVIFSLLACFIWWVTVTITVEMLQPRWEVLQAFTHTHTHSQPAFILLLSPWVCTQNPFSSVWEG